MKSLIFIVVTCFSINAYSADWQYAYVDDSVSYQIDASSISKRDKYIKAWLLVNYKEAKSVETGYKTMADYKSVKQLTYYDCLTRITSTTTANYYSLPDGAGDIVHNFSYPLSPTHFFDVVPETIGEAVFNFVCVAAVEKDKQKGGA